MLTIFKHINRVIHKYITTPSANDTDTPTLNEPGTTKQNESTETSTTTARRYPARERAEPDRLMLRTHII
jgi:hypothetical protein